MSELEEGGCMDRSLCELLIKAEEVESQAPHSLQDQVTRHLMSSSTTNACPPTSRICSPLEQAALKAA